MLEDKLNNAVEKVEKDLALLKAQSEVLSGRDAPDFRHDVVLGGQARFVIYDISDLHAAREYLREVLGEWNDTLGTIWYACGRPLVSWENTDPDCCIGAIWLETSIESFPAALKGPNCKWIERVDKDYVYVCDVPDGAE
jgi:hypothetical protein